MGEELLKEIYADVKSLNNVIRNEIKAEANVNDVNIPFTENTLLTDFFLNKTASLDNDKKTEKIARQKTLSTQLQCVQSQQELLKKTL